MSLARLDGVGYTDPDAKKREKGSGNYCFIEAKGKEIAEALSVLGVATDGMIGQTTE